MYGENPGEERSQTFIRLPDESTLKERIIKFELGQTELWTKPVEG